MIFLGKFLVLLIVFLVLLAIVCLAFPHGQKYCIILIIIARSIFVLDSQGISSDSEQNQKDITSILKDGMIQEFERRDESTGEIIKDFKINSKAAWWKTHNINHMGFGILAEAVEYLAVLANDAKFSMSLPRANLIAGQIMSLVEQVLKLSIDAKSSETMRDGRNAQTSMVDKYLRNKQERVLDIKGDKIQSSMMDAIRGKSAENSAD